uniref:Uncharacterized protein n=1 Tax=Avena sativa TaxID=4498 RepID=A0ACD5YIL5_AVESA
MLPPPEKMAQFDLNQPIIWEDEEEIVQDYSTDQDLNHGLVCGECDLDTEEHVDVVGLAGGHGRADGGAGDEGDGGRGGGVASDAHGNGMGFDLNKIANTRRRTQYTDDEYRAIYSMLLKKNGGDTMKHGVSKAVSAEMWVPVRVVQRIWLKGRRGGGIDAVVSKKGKNCGRKRIELDPDALRELPMDRRMSIQELAKAMRMKKTTG